MGGMSNGATLGCAESTLVRTAAREVNVVHAVRDEPRQGRRELCEQQLWATTPELPWSTVCGSLWHHAREACAENGSGARRNGVGDAREEGMAALIGRKAKVHRIWEPGWKLGGLPQCVRALFLGLRMKQRHRFYLRNEFLFFPLFLL